MAKRRGKIETTENNEVFLKDGGDNFDYCVDQFFKDMIMRNLSFHTKRWYKENIDVIKRAFIDIGHPLNPKDTTESMLKDVVLYCTEKLKNNPTTVNHRIRTMKQLFSFLYNESFIASNPAERMVKQKGKVEKIKPFSDDEIQELLSQPIKKEFVGFRDYTIMLVLLDTGVRLSELINMKITDVLIEGGKITVIGKGNKERDVMFQATTKEQLRRYSQKSRAVYRYNSGRNRRQFELICIIGGLKMRTLSKINQAYEEIIHGATKEPFKSRKLADLMGEMERSYNVPIERKLSWESQNRAVIALYRKISMSREL
jgi:site-specific recombinase XerD